jgi:hypothetical protein
MYIYIYIRLEAANGTGRYSNARVMKCGDGFLRCCCFVVAFVGRISSLFFDCARLKSLIVSRFVHQRFILPLYYKQQSIRFHFL